MDNANFGDQGELSGNPFVNNKTGDVEGMTITHHGKTLAPVKWYCHIRRFTLKMKKTFCGLHKKNSCVQKNRLKKSGN